jgi:hypothetical protein
MASDEWKQFLIDNFKTESDVALSLEQLTLEQIHGFLGIAERKLFSHTQERQHEGKMSHIEMWRIDEVRNLLKRARNGVGVIIGHETWQENLLKEDEVKK